jgi:macrodomain Ter protein organizer (MatP/YcbG family)
MADEFRADQISKQIETGSRETVQMGGRRVSKNVSVQQKVFTWLKQAIKPQLEARLQQTLKAKRQILKVRCFLAWRAVAKFAESRQSSSLDQQYQRLISGGSLTPSPLSKYTQHMFMDTSQKSDRSWCSELDRLCEQLPQWSREQQEREKLMRAMQLQYESLKSSV